MYLCTRNRLGYGVMVTLQILVLPFLVRVRVAQQNEENCLQFSFFLYHTSIMVCLDFAGGFCHLYSSKKKSYWRSVKKMQPFLYIRSLKFSISLGLHLFYLCCAKKKLGCASENCKDCLSTWLVQETCIFSRLALVLSLLCKEEIRLRLGKLKVNLHFLSACTNFVPR